MAILLGLAAAITYGAADFLGGYMTRRTNALTVVFIGQLLGTGLLVVALPFFLEGVPEAEWLLWGVAAGFAGGGGVIFLFRGLARGRMSLIAPVTGVEAAVLPMLYGLLNGERPSGLALAGVVIALIAITLVSLSHETEPVDPTDVGRRRLPPGLVDGLIAGFGFSLFFIFLSQTGDEAGLWPLVGGRSASLVLVGGLALITRQTVKPPQGTLPGIAGSGFLDVGANLFYLLATRKGLLSIVAVLTSLYPAATVVLARIVLEERMTPVQLVGLAFAGGGVALIALG